MADDVENNTKKASSNKKSHSSKRHKSKRSFSCGLIFPRTSIWLIASMVVLTILLVISFLSLCEFVEPSAWRWVGCGFDFVLVLSYFILFLVNVREIRHKKWSAKTDRAYINTSEMKHAFLGAVMFAFVAVFWAVFMGIKENVRFLITVNITNYIVLKFFYSLNIVIVFIMMLSFFDYPVDMLDQRTNSLSPVTIING